MISGPKVKVTLQKRTRVADSKGGSNDTWSDIVDFKAVLSPYKINKDSLNYTKESVESDHILYSKTPSTTPTIYDRITYNGRVFQIKSVDMPLMSSKILKILLMELK